MVLKDPNILKKIKDLISWNTLPVNFEPSCDEQLACQFSGGEHSFKFSGNRLECACAVDKSSSG